MSEMNNPPQSLFISHEGQKSQSYTNIQIKIMDLHSNVIWNIKIVDTIYNYTIYKNKINTEYNEYSNTIEGFFLMTNC
jgi:hypothetical protein